jgi:protein-ribulosamine 3-kinase
MRITRWKWHIDEATNAIGGCDSPYIRAYWKYNVKNEPVEECEDRNRLYSTYYYVIYSVNHRDKGKAIR